MLKSTDRRATGNTAYCGSGCQKADWKVHKGLCAGFKAGASGGGASASAAEGEM